MKFFISIIIFLSIATTVQASEFIELIYDSESVVANQKFILMVDMKIGPRDSNAEIYIESSLGAESLKMVRFSETQFATVVSGKEAGIYSWVISAYFQDSDYFKNHQLHLSYIDGQIDKIKLKILDEMNVDKRSLLNQAILELEQERNALGLEMKKHRQHLETKVEDIEVSSSIRLLDNDIPYLTMNYLESRTYLEDLGLKFKVVEGNKGPYLYTFNSSVNSHAVKARPISVDEYMLDVSNGKVVVGENSLVVNFTYANVFKLEAINQSILSLGVRKTKFILLRDSALDPSLRSYYQKEIDDLNMIENYFASYRQNLFKEGQSISGLFDIGAYSNPLRVSSGYSFACGIYRAAAYCWGKNDHQQLGIAHQNDTNYPTTAVIGLDTNIHQISSGQSHACALKELKLYCWGSNYNGEVGGGTVGGVMPVTEVSLPGEVKQVAAGGLHTCAIVDGAVYCWGSNQDGQLGRIGQANRGVPMKVDGLEAAVLVKTGLNFTCALIENGKVFCWGANTFKQIGSVVEASTSIPHEVEISEVVDIATGSNTSCALKKSGGVFCWGGNTFMQLGQNGPPYFSAHPIEVYGLGNGVTKISVGRDTVCAVQDSRVKCLGRGQNGSLGNPNYSNVHVDYPVDVLVPEGRVHDLSMGYLFGCASIDSKNYCWGQNFGGNIGNGNGVGYHALTPAMVFDHFISTKGASK